MLKEECRYHLMRPEQIRLRREACPVAYLPIGTIEWHGHHLPTGTDALQSEHMANLCAQQGGGLSFPPLYYGEPRLTHLMEGNDPRISEEMGLRFEDFTDQNLYPCDAWEEQRHYQLLLMRLLAQLESLGFKLAVIVVGHYPLTDHATAAATLFNKRPCSSHRPKHERMLAWSCVDYLLVKDRWPKEAGDHAGGWETSHILDSHPETVDMSVLPSPDQPLIGAGGYHKAQDATAEFGRETMSLAVERCLGEVERRMNPETRKQYYVHGCSMS